MQIQDAALDDALTVDQLIAELQAAKAGGHLQGTDKVAFGTVFMSGCWPVKGVIVENNMDDTRSVGLSAETESEWQSAALMGARGEEGLAFWDANDTSRPKTVVREGVIEMPLDLFPEFAPADRPRGPGPR